MGPLWLASWHWQVVTLFMNFLSFRRLPPDCSRQTDRQTDGQTDRRTDRRSKVREIQTTSSSSWNGLGENNVFLVGVTNLAPPLALIKIRTEQLLSLIFQLTSFVYFCKYQKQKEREIRRSTDQPDRKRSTARATMLSITF